MGADPATAPALHHARLLAYQRRERRDARGLEVRILLEQADQLVNPVVGYDVATVDVSIAGRSDCDLPSASGLEARQHPEQPFDQGVALSEVILPARNSAVASSSASRPSGGGRRPCRPDSLIVAGEHVGPLLEPASSSCRLSSAAETSPWAAVLSELGWIGAGKVAEFGLCLGELLLVGAICLPVGRALWASSSSRWASVNSLAGSVLVFVQCSLLLS